MRKGERNLKYVESRAGRPACYVTEITLRGRRIRRFAGHTKDQARQFVARLRLEGPESVLSPPKPGGKTFGEYARSLLDSAEWKQKRSAVRNETSLKNLNRRFKETPLSDIRPNVVRDYMTERTKAGKTPATANRERSLLVTVLYAAVADGLIESNPIGGKGVRRLEENNSREQTILALGLTDEDMRRLIDCADSSFKPIVQTALLTGMRLGEILSLKWSQVDFDRLTLTIPVERAKSKRERTIPLSSALIETLTSIEHRSEYIFPNGKTHRKSVARAFKAACKRAKITPGREGLRFHDLRHLAASNLVKVTDIVTASKILGHASVEMTLRYVHTSDLAKRAAVEELGNWLQGRQNHANGSEEGLESRSVAVPLDASKSIS